MHLLAVLVAGAVLAGCGQDDESAEGGERRTTDPAFAEFGVPAYPAAEQFDSGRVVGTDGSEIGHASFATGDSPDEVLAFYRQRLGNEGFSAKGSGGTWRLPPGQRTERTISVGTADDDVGPPGTKAPESATTVIAVSRISRR